MSQITKNNIIVRMNIEHAIELVSSLETQIQKTKEESTKYGQGYGTVAIYKDLVKITNFIDEECSNDYSLRSLIKKFNDIKNVMACELHKKFLLLDFSQDFYISTEILESVSLVYGNLYRSMLINEFCKNVVKFLTVGVDPTSVKHVIKLLRSFYSFIDSDKVNMFSNEWNISYYLWLEFKKYMANVILNFDNIQVIDIVDVCISIRELEKHISDTFIKKNSPFTLECSICQYFNENEYCEKLYIDSISGDITRFKETLTTNFNVRYNTGADEYVPTYKTQIQPFTTSLDLFSFIKQILSYTTVVSPGKIFKKLCNEIFILLKHYAKLNISYVDTIISNGFGKIAEYALFSVINTCCYCMTAIDSMDTSLKLTELDIPIEKIKIFYSNNVFMRTINVLVKETIDRIKPFGKELQSTRFDEKNDKKEQERIKNRKEAIDKYIYNVLQIYGDTTHAFIGKSLKGLDNFCFSFVFKSITYQLLDCVIQDILGLKNVAPKYSVYFIEIFEKLMGRIHSLFSDPLCQSIAKFQTDVDTMLTKINKIVDAMSIDRDYTMEDHNKIFMNNEISFDNILQLKGQTILSNLTNIQISTGNLPSPPSLSGIKNMPNISNMSNIPSAVTNNPVTNVVKDSAGKMGSFITGALGTIGGKDKDKTKNK